VILPLPEGFPSTGLLPATVALAIREAIVGVIPELGREIMVKWPNDVYLKMKKLCGILIERLTKTLFAAGIGINVNMTEDDIPSGLRHKACSLRTITGRTFHRAQIIEAILGLLLQYRQRLLENPLYIVEQFNRLSLTRDRYVLITASKNQYRALALGMEPDGALKVKTEDDKILRVTSSDVEVLIQ
jgi:BirA family biotin operon repressor/biotin-[acetyl-CoA-carboxylase] ligase